jgi:hypothetical protein
MVVVKEETEQKEEALVYRAKQSNPEIVDG